MLAILALAVAGHGFAQEKNGSPDGLYAVPDAGESGDATQDTTANRSTQSYLNALDAQSEKFKRELERAEAAHKATVAAAKAKNMAEQADSAWSVWRPQFSESAWIAIWAGVGLLVSLTAGGFVWWSRIQNSKADATVLLAVTREPAAKPGSIGKPAKPPRRRAA